jgi:hypothetical protein
VILGEIGIVADFQVTGELRRKTVLSESPVGWIVRHKATSHQPAIAVDARLRHSRSRL